MRQRPMTRDSLPMRFPSALLIVLLAWLAPARAQQWVEHRPPDAGYRVEFPAAPKVAKENIDTPVGKAVVTMAEYEKNGSFVLVAMHTVYPSGPPDPQIFLDGALDGGLKSANATLREKKQLTVGGKPARRIVMEMPDGLMGVALVVLDGNRLYNAMAVVPRGEVNSADVERFLNSFALVPR
jgi:hypothetical protein